MKETSLIFWHTIIILLAWLSPFWLDWKLIFICSALYWLQILIFKGCILTNIQFKDKIKLTKKSDRTMYAFWADWLGFKPNRKKLKFLAVYIMPLIVLIIAILWQIVLKMPVLLKI